MNTEELVRDLIHRSRIVFQDAVSGTYKIISAYEIFQTRPMRSSGFIDKITRHKYFTFSCILYTGYVK
jgi:hypothetical protein